MDIVDILYFYGSFFVAFLTLWLLFLALFIFMAPFCGRFIYITPSSWGASPPRPPGRDIFPPPPPPHPPPPPPPLHPPPPLPSLVSVCRRR